MFGALDRFIHLNTHRVNPVQVACSTEPLCILLWCKCTLRAQLHPDFRRLADLRTRFPRTGSQEIVQCGLLLSILDCKPPEARGIAYPVAHGTRSG